MNHTIIGNFLAGRNAKQRYYLKEKCSIVQVLQFRAFEWLSFYNTGSSPH